MMLNIVIVFILMLTIIIPSSLSLSCLTIRPQLNIRNNRRLTSMRLDSMKGRIVSRLMVPILILLSSTTFITPSFADSTITSFDKATQSVVSKQASDVLELFNRVEKTENDTKDFKNEIERYARGGGVVFVVTTVLLLIRLEVKDNKMEKKRQRLK